VGVEVVASRLSELDVVRFSSELRVVVTLLIWWPW
jgi:hypothetical protein